MVVRPNTHRVPDELALLQDLAVTRRAASFKALIARNKAPPRPLPPPLPRDASRRKVSAARNGAADRPR